MKKLSATKNTIATTNTAAAPSSPSAPAPALASPSDKPSLVSFAIVEPFALRLHAGFVRAVIEDRLHHQRRDRSDRQRRTDRERDPAPLRQLRRRHQVRPQPQQR